MNITRCSNEKMEKQRKLVLTLLSVVFALLVYIILPDSCPEAAKRTAFIFVIAGVFWALEIIPLYATSVTVVLLLIFMLSKPGGVLSMDEGGYTTFLVPFSSPVIILFFGGFILAQAMQKYRIDRQAASMLLKWFGKKPYGILIGFMATTAFLSMWLSNTATTAMMIAMIMPLLAGLDPDDAFRKMLALGIAFGANIGGIGTPVGTPPNAIALGILAEQGIFLTFLDWMKMAVPLVVLLLLAASLILFFVFRPKHECLQFRIEPGGSLDLKGKAAVGIAVMTVLLWLSSGWHRIPEAVVALLAAGLFVGTGLLDRDDLKRIDWDILILMWGGLALGKGMEVSGLAGWILSSHIFTHPGFILIGIFCLLAAILSTFISNTATANLVIPLAVSIPGENPVVLAIMIALSCSIAMALPISTPPNAIAFSSNVISGREMFIVGFAISLFALVVLLVGFKWMLGAWG